MDVVPPVVRGLVVSVALVGVGCQNWESDGCPPAVAIHPGTVGSNPTSSGAFDVDTIVFDCPPDLPRASFIGPTNAQWEAGEVEQVCIEFGGRMRDLGPLLPTGVSLELPPLIHLSLGEDLWGHGRSWIHIRERDTDRTLVFITQVEGNTGFGASARLLEPDPDACKARYKPESRAGQRIWAFGRRTAVEVEIDGQRTVIEPGAEGAFGEWSVFAGSSFVYGDTAASTVLANGGAVEVGLIAFDVLPQL